VINSNGVLVAHGTPITTHLEMAFFRKGVAVKVRDGAMKQDE
jgi:archaeosine-15-forming tRNA-guanine transglycosylase